MNESPKNRRGAALLMALAMLGLFSLLGAAYIKSMEFRLDSANYGLRKARAGALAGGAVRAAMAELQAAAAQGGQAALIGQTKTYTFPAYEVRDIIQDGVENFTVENNESRIAQAEVTISQAPADGGDACYRIACDALYANTVNVPSQIYNRVSARVEALIALRADGACEIIQWHHQGRRPAEAPSEPAQPAA